MAAAPAAVALAGAGRGEEREEDSFLAAMADVDGGASKPGSARPAHVLPWTPAEDTLILQGVRDAGCRWSLIAVTLPGRSDNAVRNRWHRLEKADRQRREAIEAGRTIEGYRCRKCGQYKKGHMCLGLQGDAEDAGGEALPGDSSEPVLEQPPAPPSPKASSSSASGMCLIQQMTSASAPAIGMMPMALPGAVLGESCDATMPYHAGGVVAKIEPDSVTVNSELEGPACAELKLPTPMDMPLGSMPMQLHNRDLASPGAEPYESGWVTNMFANTMFADGLDAFLDIGDSPSQHELMLRA